MCVYLRAGLHDRNNELHSCILACSFWGGGGNHQQRELHVCFSRTLTMVINRTERQHCQVPQGYLLLDPSGSSLFPKTWSKLTSPPPPRQRNSTGLALNQSLAKLELYAAGLDGVQQPHIKTPSVSSSSRLLRTTSTDVTGECRPHFCTTALLGGPLGVGFPVAVLVRI